MSFLLKLFLKRAERKEMKKERTQCILLRPRYYWSDREAVAGADRPLARCVGRKQRLAEAEVVVYRRARRARRGWLRNGVRSGRGIGTIG